MSSAAQTIVSLNIEHFKKLFETETDPHKRKSLIQLLAEQEAKLAKLDTQKQG